jgi:hypothetical protein
MSLLAMAALAGPERTTPTDKTRLYKACATACSEAQAACEICYLNCLERVTHGHREDLMCIHLTMDCAELCDVAGKLASRNSPFAEEACKAAARASERCAQECLSLPSLKPIYDCALACQKCADACRSLIHALS